MKNILIIQTAFLGDVILSTSLVETLHHAYPQSFIDVLVKKQYAKVLDNNPYIRNVLVFDKKKSKLKEIVRIIKFVRSQKYDTVINIHRFFSSGLITAFSQSKIRSGFRKNPFSFLFTHRSEHHYNDIHETDRNLQLIAFTGIEKALMPRLYPSKDDIAKVSDYKRVPYICVAPASIWFTKQFPSEKWIEFIDNIPSSVKIYIIGSEDDIQMAEYIISKVSHQSTFNLCGKTSLLQTASLMKDAMMNYVNDSAPMHISSGLNAPVTAVFCSTVPDFGFGPLSNDAQIVETNKELPCRPCGIHGKKKCPENHFLCAKSIEIQSLTARIKIKHKTSQHD
jgi:lipopolysaccharide heptosyltransferase II